MDRTARAQLLATTTVIASLAACVLGLLFARYGGSTRTDLIAAGVGWILATTIIGRVTDEALALRSVCLLLGTAIGVITYPLLRLAGVRIRIAL